MPSNFRIDSFEPKEIEKAQTVIDEHLNEVFGIQPDSRIEKKEPVKKSLLKKLLSWFK